MAHKHLTAELDRLAQYAGVSNTDATLPLDELAALCGLSVEDLRQALSGALREMPGDFAMRHVQKTFTPAAAAHRLTPIASLLTLKASTKPEQMSEWIERLQDIERMNAEFLALASGAKDGETKSPPAMRTFDFDGHLVRTVMREGSVWFVASDVADVLEYRLAGDMTRVLDDDEKGTHIVRTLSKDQAGRGGGDQELIVINESGLYHALLKSRKPEAKPFRKWVTAEVLPEIRRTGVYVANGSAVATAARLDLGQLRFTPQTWRHLQFTLGGEYTRALLVWRMLQMTGREFDWHSLSLNDWVVEIGGAVRRTAVGNAIKALALLGVIQFDTDASTHNTRRYRLCRAALEQMLSEATQLSKLFARDADATVHGRLKLAQRYRADRPRLRVDSLARFGAPNLAQE